MNQIQRAQNREMTAFDLWQKLRAGWRHVVGGAAIGLLVAGLVIVRTPPQYEAVAIVQVGQIGQIGPIGQANGPLSLAPSLPVEPPANAVERIKTAAFQSGVAERLGNQAWIDALRSSSSASGPKYLSAQVLKSTVDPRGLSVSLIELKATGDSVEDTKRIAEEAVAELARRHTEIARPLIEKMQVDVAIAKAKLASAEKETESLNKFVTNVGVKDDRFTQLSLMTSLRIQKEAEFLNQRQIISMLEAALRPPATQSAKAIEEIFVSDRPVSPKRALLLALGLIGGLFAGVVSVFASDAWRCVREARTAGAASQQAVKRDL